MKHLKLTAKLRTQLGHKAKHVKREGSIPAVVYSKTVDSTPLTIDYKEFYHIFKQAGKTQVLDLSIDEKKAIPVIVHDIYVHPVTSKPEHIDFKVVNLKEKVVASIPVVIEGEAVAVKEFGGVLNINFQELEVEALPDNLPHEITVNVESLKTMDDVITIADLTNSDQKFVYILESDTVVASMVTQTEEPPEEEVVDISEIPSDEAPSTEDKTKDKE
jgi:large subunit ribosomal protein L25